MTGLFILYKKFISPLFSDVLPNQELIEANLDLSALQGLNQLEIHLFVEELMLK